MPPSRRKATGRSGRARYINIPNQCLISENFASLSPYACKLLLDFAAKYTGYNNGDLNMVWPEMQKRGWKSKATLYKARKELIARGWIIQARQGWNNRCSLYAISFLPIGAFGSKLDIGPTEQAPNDWKNWRPEN
jgi:hypothetical protein